MKRNRNRFRFVYTANRMESGAIPNGEYSKLEKDFLGNERMVHYDASGKITGASEVIREADGSYRIGVPVPVDHAHQTAASTKPEPKQPTHVVDAKETYSTGTLATYGIGAFVVTAILALIVVNLMKGSGETPSQTRSTIQDAPVSTPVPTPNQDEATPPDEEQQRPPIMDNREPDGPNDRRIPQRNEAQPNVQPDTPNAPSTDEQSEKPKPKPKDEPGKDNGDPIDLRGGDGGVEPPPDNGSSQTPDDIR